MTTSLKYSFIPDEMPYKNKNNFDFSVNNITKEEVHFFLIIAMLVSFIKLESIVKPQIFPFILIWFIFSIVLLIHNISIAYKKRNKYLMNIQTIEEMKKLNWREFEKFIEFVFRQKWFKTKLWKWQNDWWIDIEAELNWKKYVIQCKKWNKYKIWVTQIREFYWVVKMRWDETKWIYITTSSLTKEAEKEYNKIKDQMKIWDNSNLEKYVRLFKWMEETKEEINKTFLICNKCWWNMILRKASRWEFKWKEFYGCENYPKCRNIINIKQK